MAKKVQNRLEEGLHNEPTIAQRFKVQFDFDYIPSAGYDPNQNGDNEEVVKPNLSLTVRQLMERHTRGTNGEVNVRQPLYYDFTIPTLDDITDVAAFQRSLEERLEQTKRFMKEQHEEYKRLQAIKQQEKTEAERAEYERLHKTFGNPKKDPA